jgi:hypothetical protein
VFDEEEGNPLVGAVNLRMFNIQGGPSGEGEIVMDTLGLEVFGLPDLQCHYNGLPPNAVASHLYNLAGYLFDHGDVIEDGHTVQGLEVDQIWKCQHEESLLDPKRVVLDVCPHTPHSAGRP